MAQYVNDFNQTVKLYYDDLKKYKPLTKAKEKKLIKLCKKGNLKAKNTIIESNLRFVFNIAKRYTGRGVSIDDLISEGNLGLIRAIDKFDETKNVKFISYAIWWIRQAMLESIQKRKQLNNFEINPNESNANMIEAKISDDEDEKISFHETNFSNEKEEKNKEKNAYHKEIVNNLLNVLSKREKEIIQSFYGLNNKNELSLTEIGEQYNLSIERVRQIKIKGLRKIRSNIMLYKDFEEILS